MKLSLRGVLAYLLATAVFLIILIAVGVFDPKPVGELQRTLPGTSLTVNQRGQTVVWLDEPLPDGDFSVRGTAVLQEGNPDSGIGLAVGSEAHAFVVAVSPLGYVLVQHGDEVVLPWQPWPHVRADNTPNEIWIDVRGNEITVRLNRELLWQGTAALETRRLGLFSEGFGGETAVYTISTIEIFATENTED
ncbi:hypothetical protein [Candidatus Leptofilum sp.]|uniref:hypothetical protein n=1 Tax=Candidatus Leptofilum sp. TaxID=3241576 RepID=UPI003B58F23F